ncbi:hypothetical protein [Chlorogloea sp. CCALA 695]|uniref:hypothetical protein n=1 Tax=Chlorogloea sp. CCALA 695 TaxID=2107693 RepID=UPI000D06A72C|nr:hypothetical protein [Chlorogloea sp. CCALA 695]PSB25571.1 hypothetical protein C7B70_24715 [Chlorogloea sp. CCALA 695]
MDSSKVSNVDLHALPDSNEVSNTYLKEILEELRSSKQQLDYVIQSGLGTLFAKGLIYTLAMLPVVRFNKPMTIAVEPGDTEQVLFSRVYNPVTGIAAYAPYNEPVNWQHTIVRAISKIDTAHGRLEQAP